MRNDVWLPRGVEPELNAEQYDFLPFEPFDDGMVWHTIRHIEEGLTKEQKKWRRRQKRIEKRATRDTVQ